MSDKSKARRQRKLLAAQERDLAALAFDCPVPTCKAVAGVWCGFRPISGPWLHERRYARADEVSSG